VSKLICIILLLASCITNAREIVLTRHNSYLLAGRINPMSMAMHTAMIASMSAFNSGETFVVIFSPGGAVEPVLLVKDMLKQFKNVSTVIVSAQSMAAAISQTLPGRRYIVSRGEMMFHRIRTDFEGEITLDTLDKLREYLQADDTTVNHMCHDRLRIPYSEYIKRITNTNWTLNANEAIAVGAADEIVTAKCADDIRKLNIQVTTYSEYTGTPVPRNICDLL
jgi:ATP-dependent protease ClpP protease subunit